MVVTVLLVGGPYDSPDSVLVTVFVLTSGSVTCDVTVVILGVIFTANIK